MVDVDRIERDRLVDEAMTTAGESDFGEGTWGEGLDVLLESLREEARLNDVGVEVAAGAVRGYLANRLAITGWRRDHPEVAGGSVDQPIVIVGQPRTGTTILHDLLAQDPELRAPLSWEVERPVPPPETATFDTDPRIDEVQAALDMADLLLPGFTKFHPMGARLAQECVCITACDFRSLIFPIQFHVPTYNHWLVHEADMAPAYRWHRQFLQHLESRHPAGQWLLKSPAHLWHFGALAHEYPDALIVQTHRDPLKVIASVSALAAHLRRMACDDPSIEEAAAQYADDIFLGLERGIADRRRGTFAPEQIIDVHFSSFVADPLATIGAIYDALGRALTAETKGRMQAFLADNPGDGGGGGTRYTFSDTGLDAGALRERATKYQEYFGVESERLT